MTDDRQREPREAAHGDDRGRQLGRAARPREDTVSRRLLVRHDGHNEEEIDGLVSGGLGDSSGTEAGSLRRTYGPA